MRTPRNPSLWLTTVLALAATACDDEGLSDETFQGEPLATMVGTISTADASALREESISMTLVWDLRVEIVPVPDRDPIPTQTCNGEFDSEGFTWPAFNEIREFKTQASAFEARFPLDFQFPIFDLPPEESLVEIDDGAHRGKIAFAKILVFDDANGNDVFDAPNLNATGERVDFYSEEQLVVYFDGVDLDPNDDFSFPTGFSLYRLENGGATAVIEPLEDGLVLDLFTTDEERESATLFLCSERENFSTFVSSMPDGFSEEDLVCDEDGRSYSWSERRTRIPGTACQTTRRVVRACLEDDAPVPTDWPCDVE